MTMKPINKKFALRFALILAVLAAAVGLKSAGKSPFTTHDRAYYASPDAINFVRPGLVFKITGASIAWDGTVTAKLTMTDPQGLTLDRLGIQTPGAISASLMISTIPKGQKQYTAYTTRIQTSPITNQSATQASTDTGGKWVQNADGSYTYTFATKAPSGWDASATHTVGVFGARDLTAFDLGTNHATDVYSFVPNGSAVADTRDVVRSASCNACHTQLSFHGGNRIGVEACVLCHTPQTTDPDTGNTVNFPVLIHKLHMGSALPSVKAGGKYQIIGFNQSVSDWSDVNFPADAGGTTSGVARCEICHDPNSGAKQAMAYLTNPNQAACGACHDDVNFATGLNHVNLPQPNDAACSTCHVPQGQLEFDASIKGAHTIPTESTQHPGLAVSSVKVDNGVAGKAPTVTFTAKDKNGNPVNVSQTAGLTMALVLGGPAADPGYTNFGSDVTTAGYVSEDATKSKCGTDGTCVYQFSHSVPKDATGTYYIEVEGRRQTTLNPGTTQERPNISQGMKGVVVNFSVDGSPVQPRRTVVALTKCNACHSKLSLHGENRNQIEQCVVCHNPSETDATYKSQATNPADRTTPLQGVNFALMIHKIHTGATQAANGYPYVIVGFRGSHNEWSDVEFPSMTLAGSVGAANNCDMCHVNGSEQNFPTGLKSVTNPQGLINPTPPVTAACTACHSTKSAVAHAAAQTNQLGESCDVCHGASAEFNVSKVHAQ
jgi:OmcA/MtrC family decaheme c-type cytochrome